MFDLNCLIGKELEEAKKILIENNENKIEVTENSKHSEKCDCLLVCKAEKVDETVKLVCGEFCVNLKG